jgi:hypothetical protein
MKKVGKSDEEIARYANERRRKIGNKYKNKTPPKLREIIYGRNAKQYEDKLGPTYEELKRSSRDGKRKPKTDKQIIESTTRPDGKNLKDKGLFDKPELNWRKYKDD